MDIGKIFEVMNEDNKDIILSIAIDFPVAYMDCWKLQPAFKAYDLMPQIVLALSVSILFVALGIMFCFLVFILAEKFENRTIGIRYQMPLLLMLFLILSIAILRGQVKTMEGAVIYYGALFVFVLACYSITYVIYNRKRTRVR